MARKQDHSADEVPACPEWAVGLNDRQRRFVEEYCVDFNATRAARTAGYSEATAYSLGGRLLKKVEIRKAVDERLDELTLTTEEALKRLSEYVTADVIDFLVQHDEHDDKDPGSPFRVGLTWQSIVKSGKTHLIKSISQTTAGIRIELHDPQAAIDKILRVRGAYKDRLDVTSKDQPLTEIRIVRTTGDRAVPDAA